jgi:AcrR family transcriptional regulator
VVDGVLTAEQILAAAEDVLRRFGPAKATVVDVARVLGVSHGSVYRHFPTKAALRAAVTHRWLERTHAGLAELAAGDSPAPERLLAWLSTLFEAKRKKMLDDPELSATYSALARESSGMISEHLADLARQLAAIIASGAAAGDFADGDTDLKAQAVFDATARFHDPMYAAHWTSPGIDEAFDAVCELVLAGLAKRS